MKSARAFASPASGRLACAALSLGAVVALGCSDRPIHLLDGDGGGGSSSSDGGSAQGAGGLGGGGATSTGGAGVGGQVPTASFELSVDDGAPEIELRDSVELTVSISPNGYSGSVALTLEGIPADVASELSATSVALGGTETETVTLTLTSASDTVSGAFPFTIAATAADGEEMTAPTLTVLPAITITIPLNLGGYASNPPDQTAFGDYPTRIKSIPDLSAASPIRVRFFNADITPHRIHADAPDDGFAHGDVDIPPNAFDPLVREVSIAGQYDYYPHDIGQTIVGRIIIEE